jgi:hypothetical protein
MKSVIWKFPIPAEGTFKLDLPEGPYRPLAVQMQHVQQGVDVATLWIHVSADPNARKLKRTFHVVPTGQPFDDEGLLYVGTFQPASHLVFHLFQVPS